MNDVYTRMLAFMAGIEVKPAYGGSDVEAQSQLAIFTAAGSQCRRRLLGRAIGDARAMDGVPMLGWTVTGHRWEMYFVMVDDAETGNVVSLPYLLSPLLPPCGSFIPILTSVCNGKLLHGPESVLSLNTRILEDVFKLRALMREVKRYGRDVYWEAVKKSILQPLSEGRSGGATMDNFTRSVVQIPD